MYKILSAFVILLLLPFSTRADNSVLSPFDNSEERLNYTSRFTPLTLMVGPLDNKNSPSTTVVEGALNSRVFMRADDTSDYEIYKSYLSTLESSGFDILLACEKKSCNAKNSAKQIYWFGEKEIVDRPYKRVTKNARKSETEYLTGWVSYYISAKKTIEGKTVYVMVIASTKKELYSIDELITTSMESNTVTLNLDALNDELKTEGKVVLTGLFFKTGSSVLTDESKPALDTVAKYLEENPDQSFYVVGHTDDTGKQMSNLSLSRQRAESVVKALQSNGTNDSRLSPQGVGPYSPASSNSSEDGRKLNRRVELVLRVP